MFHVQLDPEEVNRQVSAAIIQSSLGKQLHTQIDESLKNILQPSMYGTDLVARIVEEEIRTSIQRLLRQNVFITMTSAGSIWKSATSDSTNIYLTADSAGRTAEIFVR